jgi:hypothetical protein
MTGRITKRVISAEDQITDVERMRYPPAVVPPGHNLKTMKKVATNTAP